MGQQEQQIARGTISLVVQPAPATTLGTAGSAGDHIDMLKSTANIAIWLTWISAAVILAIFVSLQHIQPTSLWDRSLLVVSTLLMLASFIFGAFLLWFSFVQLISPPDAPRYIRKINVIRGIAIGSLALGVITLVISIVVALVEAS